MTGAFTVSFFSSFGFAIGSYCYGGFSSSSIAAAPNVKFLLTKAIFFFSTTGFFYCGC